ncbi:MAG: hypothetical protein K6F16_09345 [Lachnospiraceae bacterium]|nr:hypothetical protein [Lachnospiraceae bacterium]
MRSFFNKAAALFLALVLCLGIAGPAATQVRAEEAVTAAAAQEGKDFLKNVIGEYVPLFEGASFEAKYDHYWHDYSAAVAGESMADMCVAMMKQAIGASTYGKDAGEEFFCGFTADVVKIAFGGEDGTDVTYTLKNGKTVKHSYVYVKDAAATGETEGQEMVMNGYLYKSADDNKDEFTYLYMCPDTPDTTYHLEFRYGSDEKNILKLTDGKYKNWLAAGFTASALDDPKEELISRVIGLFVYENLEAMSGDECAAQRASIAGTWDMDTTAFKDYPGYENASMYIELSAAGTGKSYVDMTGSGAYMLASEYPFYTYGTKDASGTEKGVYLVVSDDEGLKTATYEISEKDGVKTLLFNSSEGVITYYGRNAVIAAPEITKTKVKKSKTLTVAWKAVENADGYEVTYSTSKKFKKAKTVSVSKASAKIKNLKKKNYYVKVRGYVLDPLGNKVYGEYSQTSVIKNK